MLFFKRKYSWIKEKRPHSYYGQIGLVGFAFHWGAGKYSGDHQIGKNFHWTTWSAIDRLGISFFRKGSQLYWLWPWRRKGRGKYFELDSGGVFKSLKEIDAFWIEYYEACYRKQEEETIDT